MTGWIVKQKYFSHKGPEKDLNLDCGLIFESKILPFVSLVYCAWFWYINLKQRNGIHESQVFKLCRYCQNQLCFQWLGQVWCAGGWFLLSIILSLSCLHLLLSFYYHGLPYLFSFEYFNSLVGMLERRQNERRQWQPERFGVFTHLNPESGPCDF